MDKTRREEQFFADYLYRELPISRAMQVRVDRVAPVCVSLSAPLEANRNDKHTGFGGCLASLLFMAGWGWLFNTLRRTGVEADIVIQDGELSFRKPTLDPLTAHCTGPGAGELELFLDKLRLKSVARLELSAFVGEADAPNVILNGRFVARLETPT
ncbi:MAG: YiiD C-terminal domain-containing protein [Pseudomonadota bacterium]